MPPLESFLNWEGTEFQCISGRKTNISSKYTQRNIFKTLLYARIYFTAAFAVKCVADRWMQ